MLYNIVVADSYVFSIHCSRSRSIQATLVIYMMLTRILFLLCIVRACRFLITIYDGTCVLCIPGWIFLSGHIRSSYGGVARNIAEAIARLGLQRPLLVSAVGLDHAGEGLLAHSKKAGVDVSAMLRPESTGLGVEVGTATYAAVHDHR
jgi:hypothetical protein